MALKKRFEEGEMLEEDMMEPVEDDLEETVLEEEPTAKDFGVSEEIQRAVDKALAMGGSREEQIDAVIMALEELKSPTAGLGGLGGESLDLGEPEEEEIM